MTPVLIYTTSTCPWCVKTKEFLKQNKISYKEINVVGNVKAQREMVQKSGQMGVPVLDIDGTIVVGFDTMAIKSALKSILSAHNKRKKTVRTQKSVVTQKRKLSSRR